jgi:hypothetical protein
MAMVKVIYVEQTAGKVTESRLNDLIAKGKIAAFCSSHGWVNVMSEQRIGYCSGVRKPERKGSRS